MDFGKHSPPAWQVVGTKYESNGDDEEAMEDEAVCMHNVGVIVALMEGCVDVVFIQEDISVGMGDAEVPDAGPVVALAGTDEDWGCVDGIFLVEEVVEGAMILEEARDVGGWVNDHAPLSTAANVAKGGKEDAIDEVP